jgi:hypothetical protein
LKEEVFLKSFGVMCLHLNTLPDYPKAKSNISKGTCSAVKLWIEGKKDWDTSIFKCCKSIHPAVELFGDIWGKDYPIEKTILDRLINHLRKQSFITTKIRDWIKADSVLSQEKGLDIDLKSDLLTETETSFLKGVADEGKLNNKFSIPTGDSGVVDPIAINKLIKERQKSLRELKSCIKVITSERLTAVFSLAKSKKEKDEAKKTKISVLVEKAKENEELIQHFNPTMVFLSLGLPRLPAHGSYTDDGYFTATFSELIFTVFDKLEKDHPTLALQGLNMEYKNFVKSNYN